MLTSHRWTCVFSLGILTIAGGLAAAAAPPDHSARSSVASAGKKAIVPSGPDTQTAGSTAAARQGGGASALSSSDLPVRRVVLYKSGVGFFEHQGQVRGDQSVAIDFTSGQLNDVLQSLTVLDLNGGRITGVDYNSEAPFSERLGTLSLPLTANTNLAEFYGALRGVRLRVRNGTTEITGRLLSVESKTRSFGETTFDEALAVLVSDTGEVRSVEITPAVTVQVADKDATQEVGRYLSLLASARQEQLRRMTIATAGSGARDLYVSYISEVPIWKTTYRIVLPSKKGDEPLLQGWAIVDNTVGEDWNNVELSLVAGAPQSFIQQLSQPYYARRPVVGLPETAQLSPQTHEGAMTGGVASLTGMLTDPSGAVIANANVMLMNAAGENAGTVVTDGRGRYSFSDLPAGNYQLRANSPGFQTSQVNGLALGGGREFTQNVQLNVGAVSTAITVTANTASVETDSAERAKSRNVGLGNELGSNLGAPASRSRGVAFGTGSGGMLGSADQLAAARQQMASAANGSDLGDLFEYKLKDRVTIHKNESALVPILQEHVGVQKVSLWNQSLGSARPLRALWLNNSSALTLDGGSFSVLEDETFAGEGITDPIKPGEKRIVSYASDLGVRVEESHAGGPQQVTRVHILKGVMWQTREQREATTYTIRNDDTSPRDVVIEHPVRPGWNLNPNDPKPAETTSGMYRFLVGVGAKGTATYTVRESSPMQTSYTLNDLTTDQITLFVNQKTINPTIETALRKIVAQKDRVSELDSQISDLGDETQKIFDDQERLRENLKALKGSSEERALTQRYTQQLADQENRLDAIKKETSDLQDKHDAAQQQLDKMIEDLSLDADI